MQSYAPIGGRNCKHVYQLDGKDLGVVDEEKDLGVIIQLT